MLLYIIDMRSLSYTTPLYFYACFTILAYSSVSCGQQVSISWCWNTSLAEEWAYLPPYSETKSDDAVYGAPDLLGGDCHAVGSSIRVKRSPGSCWVWYLRFSKAPEGMRNKARALEEDSSGYTMVDEQLNGKCSFPR